MPANTGMDPFCLNQDGSHHEKIQQTWQRGGEREKPSCLAGGGLLAAMEICVALSQKMNSVTLVTTVWRAARGCYVSSQRHLQICI